MLAREVAAIPAALRRQYQRRDLIERRQLAGLNDMLAAARREVSWYRDSRDYAALQLNSLADLTAFPVLDKSDLRAGEERFWSNRYDAGDCQVFRTSGSTGARVTVRHDQRSHDYHSATLVRRFLATGTYRPTDSLCHIRPFAPPTRMHEKFGLFRRHVLSTERPMAAVARELVEHRPRVIVGYPVHLRAVLRELDTADLTRLRSGLRFVMTESELLVPSARTELEAAFGVPVFDEYSAYEVLNIAYDCTEGRAHLSEDRLVVEVVDDDGRAVEPGEEGRIVVTAFMERAMPLLRYDVGDRGRVLTAPCPCSRTFHTVQLTTGRINDFVTLPDGRRLYPDTFLHIAATHPGVSECYVHQQPDGRIEFFLVPDPGAGDDVTASVERRIREVADGPVELSVSVTSTMRMTAAGKGRFVTSEYQQV